VQSGRDRWTERSSETVVDVHAEGVVLVDDDGWCAVQDWEKTAQIR
jgi:hypothetical protein